MKCSKCGSTRVAVKCEVWVNYYKGRPEEVEPDDVDEAEPLPKTSRVCRDCQHYWKARA